MLKKFAQIYEDTGLKFTFLYDLACRRLILSFTFVVNRHNNYKLMATLLQWGVQSKYFPRCHSINCLQLIWLHGIVTQLLQLQHYGIMGIIRSERSVETGLAPFCLCLRYQKGIQASRGLNKSTAASLLRWVHST